MPEGHALLVSGAQDLRDGSILSWSQHGTLRLWYAETDAFIAYACTRLARYFTDEERVQFNILDNEPTCPEFATVESEMQALPEALTPAVVPST